MNATTSKAAIILAIPLDEPERLFSGPTTVKEEYRGLAKFWHPDINKSPEAADVTAHINRLLAAAEKKVAAGQWHVPGLLELSGRDGKTRRIRYRKKHLFELGEFYYGNFTVAWVIRAAFTDLYLAARNTIRGFKFASAEMGKEVKRYLPQVMTAFETREGDNVLVMEKTPDVFLLRDIMDALGGKLDPKHAAWVQSTLHNLDCYLEFAGITHNAIGPETYFISPKFHSGMLLGGWWYSALVGSPLAALPSRSRAIAPREMIKAKRADHRLDRLLVRATGREILGDITGMTLAGTAPQPMVDFLRHPSSGRAVTDYASWRDSVLPASFGARRFVKLEITDRDVFKD